MAGRAWARTPCHTEMVFDGRIGRKSGVQPSHLGGVVVPNRQAQDHASLQGLPHAPQAALGLVVVDVAKDSLLRIAELICDCASLNSREGGVSVCDNFAILHVESSNLNQVALVGAVRSMKLSHNGHGFCRVHAEVRPVAVEVLVTHAVGIHVATVLVTEAFPASVVLCAVAAVDSCAARGPDGAAGVRRERCSPLVGLPNVHLHAADAMRLVALKLLVRALRIAVASSVLGTCPVVLLQALAAHSGHLHKVDCAVEATHQRRHVDVQCELAIEKLEHLVGLFAIGYIKS
mmetsp:Transcript_55266/g.89376  ORF Transcript_55266/g.89376 Transcript_55266/m.89376 type:complete len:290 (-) Transcript_55266:425-1294(-)